MTCRSDLRAAAERALDALYRCINWGENVDARDVRERADALRAARAAEREACAKVCDEHYEFLVDVARKHEGGSPSRDRLFSAARAVDRVRQELRARADGGDRG